MEYQPKPDPVNTNYSENIRSIQSKEPVELKLYEFNPLEIKLKMEFILPAIEERVKKLEKAQKISPELLKLVIDI